MELDQQVIEQALDILKLHQDTNQQLRLFCIAIGTHTNT